MQTAAPKTSLFNYNQGHNYDFYCDLETTGFSPIRNDVIEICLLVCKRGTFEVIDKFYSLVKPKEINSITWSKGAEKIHGFTIDQAKTFPEARQVCVDLLNWLVPYKHENNWPQLFVCHAQGKSFFDKEKNEMVWGMFDYFFLEWLFRKQELQYSFWKVFEVGYCQSTVELAKRLGYGEQPLVVDGVQQYTKTGKIKKEGNGLAIWSKRIGFELEHHKAESDTEGCLRVREFLVNQHGLET